jgi:hypothetical protein
MQITRRYTAFGACGLPAACVMLVFTATMARSRRVNTTPLRGVPRLARLRSARLGGTGPLGRKAWPRVPRNPAPLARKPPVLTRHEGRRSRCSPAIGWENRGAPHHDDHSHHRRPDPP